MAKKKKEESVEQPKKTTVITETKTVKTTTTSSPSRSKVTVRPIKSNGWLPKDHDGFMRYSRCFERLTVQTDRTTALLNTGLKEEDERRIEKAMNLTAGTLSKYNRDYWSKFYMDIPKEGKVLDLNLPSHELIYLVLKAHQRVANSEMERFDTPFAEYVMSNSEEEAVVRNKKGKVKREAYNKFNSLSIDQMFNVLKVHGKKVDSSASSDFIESEIDKLVEKNPQAFLDIVSDKDFVIKVFIEDCVRARALTKSGSKYMLTGGDIIGYSLSETIDYLNDPVNQEVYINLKGRLDISK